MSLYRRILVPIDFDASSERATALAVSLARDMGSELTLVHSYDLPTYGSVTLAARTSELERAVEEDARSRLAAALAAVHAQLPTARSLLRKGPAWRSIQAAADETHADLIIIGTHGRKGLPRALLGSVAEKVVRSSKVPVMTVRTDDATEANTA